VTHSPWNRRGGNDIGDLAPRNGGKYTIAWMSACQVHAVLRHDMIETYTVQRKATSASR
jgi:hypothetical protein